MQTVNVHVRAFDVNYAPLAVDQIEISGAITGSLIGNTITNLLHPVRVLDVTTVTVTHAGMTTYTEIFNTYYGADGNLEDIYVDVVMLTNAQVGTFITNGFCYPVMRIKTNDPLGDEYFIACTTNVHALLTFDWQYPLANTISVTQDFEYHFGAIGFKTVYLDIDAGGGNICTSQLKFNLFNLRVNVCYGQELIGVYDTLIPENQLCAPPNCDDPYDLGEGETICCGVVLTRKLRYHNWDTETIVVQGTNDQAGNPCPDTSMVTGSAAVILGLANQQNIVTDTDYDVPFSVNTALDCSCGVKLSTIHLIISQLNGVDSCCDLTFNTSIDVQDREMTLSAPNINLLTVVDQCITGIVTIENTGCADFYVPVLNPNLNGGCIEQNIPVTAVYDPAQLAALIVANGADILTPGDTLDIIFEYCPIVVQNGCCDMIRLSPQLNRPSKVCADVIVQVCYSSINTPDCTENLHMCCDDIKLSVPDLTTDIEFEPALTCVVPNIDLRLSGNAFFPPQGVCSNAEYQLQIDAENLTNGATIVPIVLDPDTFNYIASPSWNSIFQFPSAGLWEVTVTANYCGTIKTCVKKFTVCHELTVTRLKCHLRRLAITSPTVQEVTVLVESIYTSYEADYSFNTGVQSYLDITLPGDDSYRVTITYVADGTTKVLYIHEICALAECFREMVQKILCNKADPCCINCDPKEVEKQKQLRYMVNQYMALFLSITAFIHKDTMSYIGVWEDDECRTASSGEIAVLIDALKKAVLRCGVCSETIASQSVTSGCTNC